MLSSWEIKQTGVVDCRCNCSRNFSVNSCELLDFPAHLVIFTPCYLINLFQVNREHGAQSYRQRSKRSAHLSGIRVHRSVNRHYLLHIRIDFSCGTHNSTASASCWEVRSTVETIKQWRKANNNGGSTVNGEHFTIQWRRNVCVGVLRFLRMKRLERSLVCIAGFLLYATVQQH